MKILQYSKNLKTVIKSGIGRSMIMQEEALKKIDVEYVKDKKEEYDIVHLNTVFPSDYRLAKKAKKEGKKVVYHAHSTEEDFRNSFCGSNLISPIYKKWLIKCYSLGDTIVTPSEYSKKLLMGYGIKNEIEVLSNGIDTREFYHSESAREEFRKEYGYSENDKVIMCVGWYFKRKGILDFVEMAKKMKEYQFIWFGYNPDSQLTKEVKKAVHTKLPNLKFAGYIPKEQLTKAYSGSDLFFFPSHEETEGIVILEALSSEIPVLVRDIPVYSDWLIDEHNVYKCKTNEEFAICIESIINKKLPLLVENGKKVALDRDLSLQGDKLMNIYSKTYLKTQNYPIYAQKISPSEYYIKIDKSMQK